MEYFKIYRWWKGGIWYNYYPKFYPYMSLWTQDKSELASHCVVEKVENYD